MSSFITELKRRNVLRVAAAYGVVSWILIEAGSVLMPLFGASEVVFKIYVVIVAAGFVAALVFAWILEVTPEGVKLEKDVDRSSSITQHTGRKLDFTIIGLLIVALAVSISLNVSGMRDAVISRASIAVLPFANLSTDPENAFFADGIHDNLLTSLANIGSLKVISRTSVMEYRDTTRNLREIGEELGVANVLEGSVARSGDNVRINVQLIDASTDEHLWAHRYDKELSAKNIFTIQTEISSAISAALKAKLTPEEMDRIADTPTENLEAYNLVVTGRANLYQRRLETVTQAREQFEQAIELDPNYAEAYSGLADSLLLLYINHSAISAKETFARAQEALDKALELDPELADTYASLGLLKATMWGQTRSGPEYDEAEEAYKRAIELNPSHSQAYAWYAGLFIKPEQSEKAIKLLRKAIELDPLARIPRSNIAARYAQMGRNEDALREWIKATEIHPDWPTPYGNMAGHLEALGRLDEAMAWAKRASDLSTDPLAGATMVGINLRFGEDEKARAFLEAVPSDHPLNSLAEAYQLFVLGDLAAADAILMDVVANLEIPPQFMLNLVADIALLSDNYEKSLDYLARMAPTLREDDNPDLDIFNTDEAVKYAYVLQQLGNNERADKILGLAMPVLQDLPRMGNAGYGILDVEILTLQGKTEEALAALGEAVDAGLRSSLAYNNWNLEESPILTAIHGEPEFQALILKINNDVEQMHQRVLAVEASGGWDELLSIAKTDLRTAGAR